MPTLDELEGDKCHNCGTMLPDIRNWNQIYCTVQCQLEHRRQIGKASRAEIIASYSCINCDGPIPPDRTVAAKYCSDACSDAFFLKAAKRQRIAAKGAMSRTCRSCGKPIALHVNKQAEFCTTKCRRRFRYATERLEVLRLRDAERKMADRRCEMCGGPLGEQLRSGSRFCSDPCRRAAQRQTQFGKMKCDGCGSMFVPHKRTTRFCSKECFYRSPALFPGRRVMRS